MKMAIFSKPVEPMLDPMSSAAMALGPAIAGPTMNHMLSRRAALLLFAVVVVIWGSNWAVTKTLVLSVSPLWATAIRSAIATVSLFVFLLARGQLIMPCRGDVPVVLTVAVLHMGAFSALVAFGLQLVSVGRSIVLGYTTPLWVAPAAWLLLREPVTRSRFAGIGLGLAGLALMFNPLAFDWSDASALIGNGLILLAALCWAANILYVRAHKWISTPFQLVFWQAGLATIVLSSLALSIDGAPKVIWSPVLAGAFLYAGVCGTALGHWAMVTVNRSLPTVTTSLGLLATPVVGVATSVICLGEPMSTSLVCSIAMILGGIAMGTISQGSIADRQAVPRSTRTIL
jgi:drug/metabolite transporter (DMT)-like permease